MWRLLRTNRDIRLLFAAQVVSYLGDWFTFVALVGLVKDLTGSEFLVSMVLVAFSLPSFLASPAAGSVVDRFDRRKVLIVVSGMQAVLALCLLGTTSAVWIGFLAQSLIAGLAAFVKPAIEAGVPNLARNDDELAAANALFGSTWGVMLAVGASLGGLFAGAFGRDAAFIADAVSFMIAGGLVVAVGRPLQLARASTPPGRIRPIADMREALAEARHDHVLLALLTSKATFAIGAGIVSQLAVLSTDVFHGGDRLTGLLIGARGVGSGIGPLIAAHYAKGDLAKVLRICGLAAIVFGGFYSVAPWAPLGLAVVCIAVAHLGGGAQWTLSTYGLQIRSADHVRGRILAGDFALVTLILSLTSALAGLASSAWGVQWCMTVFAGAAGLAGLAHLTLTRPMRQRLTPAHPSPSPTPA